MRALLSRKVLKKFSHILRFEFDDHQPVLERHELIDVLDRYHSFVEWSPQASVIEYCKIDPPSFNASQYAVSGNKAFVGEKVAQRRFELRLFLGQ